MASNNGKKAPPATGTSRKRGRSASSPASTGSSIFAPPTRKTAHTYTTAVVEIRNMFLEQASLWKHQAERLDAARTGHEPLLTQQEPWSRLIDKRGRPTNAFGEGQGENSDEESRNVEQIKQKIKKTRDWKYERPMEEAKDEQTQDDQEEASDGAKLKPTDESSDESSNT